MGKCFEEWCESERGRERERDEDGGSHLPCTSTCHSCALVKVEEDGGKKRGEGRKGEERAEKAACEKKIYCKSEENICVCVKREKTHRESKCEVRKMEAAG